VPSECSREHENAESDEHSYHFSSVVQRDLDPTTTTLTTLAAEAMSDEALAAAMTRVRLPAAAGDVGARENLATMLEAQAQRSLRYLASQGEEFSSADRQVRKYCSALQEMAFIGHASAQPPPQVVVIPADQLLGVSEDGQVQLTSPSDVVQLDADLIAAMDMIAEKAAGGGDPGSGGALGQALIWEDGRAIVTPPTTADFATLVTTGTPDSHSGAHQLTHVERPWQRAQQAAVSGVWRSGIFQLGTFPISQFSGTSLPSGSRVRFADPAFGAQWRFRSGMPADTRFMTIYSTTNKRFYSWDAHAPVGSTPHDFYHVNQKGMHGLFGHSDHAPIPASQLSAARGMRWVRIGGRVFLVLGVAVDAALLTRSAVQSVEQGSGRPLAAQALRTIGSWGGAWAGAKLLCVGGAAATIETGPGAVLGCVAGGVIGGFAGYFGADWIADMISPD